MKTFSLLHDRSIPFSGGPEKDDVAGCLATCCPAMDLVALATSSHLIVQRSIKWEKLFGSSCDVSCITWRPDGKALAVGQEDGLIVLYDVENGEEFSLPKSARPHSSPIVCMCWTKELESKESSDDDGLFDFAREEKAQRTMTNDSYYCDRTHLLLKVEQPRNQRDHQEVASFKSYASALMDMPLFGVDNTPREQLEVLVSGDTSGVVTIGAFGYFPIGCIDLSGAFESTGDGLPRVCHLRLSSDLRMLLVILESQEQYRVVSIDTNVLGEQSNELRYVAAQCGHISEQVDNVQNSIQEMAKQWAEGMSALQKHIEPLAHQLKCFERPNTPEQELFMMLTCGVTSAALQRYIADLQEQGLQRLGKMLDTTCATVEDIAANSLVHAIEVLVFRLHDMLGLAEWTQKFQPIGLSAKMVKNLLEAAQLLLLKAQETLTFVREARANFAAFTVWLQTVWRKNQKNEQGGDEPQRGKRLDAHIDIDRLVKLLSRQLLHHHITEQFKSANLSCQDQAEFWTTATQATRTELSLQQSFEELKNSWNKAFHMTSETVSAAFKPVENEILPGVKKRLVDMTFASDRFFVALSQGSSQLVLMHRRSDNGPAGISCMETVEVSLEGVRELTDIRFYNDEKLLVTFLDENGSRCLGQVCFLDEGEVKLDMSITNMRELQPAVSVIRAVAFHFG